MAGPTAPDLWSELRALLAVQHSGSYLGAAELLGSSHQTISRRIAALETYLGAQLVNVSHQGVTFTHGGRELCRVVRRLDRDLARGLDAVRQRQPLAGSFRLACCDGLLTYWLIPNLGLLTTQLPQLSLRFRRTYQWLPLDEEALDLQVAVGLPPPGFGHCRRLGTLHLQAFCASRYLAERGCPAPDRLADHRLLVNLGYSAIANSSWRHWQALEARFGSSMECEDDLALYELVKAGQGIGLLANYAQLDPDLVPLSLASEPAVDGHATPGPSAAIYAAYPSGGRGDPACQAVLGWVQAVLGGVGNRWFSPDPAIPTAPTSAQSTAGPLAAASGRRRTRLAAEGVEPATRPALG